MITMSAGQLFVWIIIGGLAGAIAGMIIRGNRRGYGLVANIVIGLLGAIIGGMLFSFFNINIAGDIVFSANDLIAAIVGSLLLLAVLAIVRRIR